MVAVRLSFVMICRHKILVGACGICLAEGTAPPPKAQPEPQWSQWMGAPHLSQEMPEPHPPTDEAGKPFHAPPSVSSAITSGAGFLQDDSAVFMMIPPRLLHSARTVVQPSYYYSEF
jgi:hypothetical protein